MSRLRLPLIVLMGLMLVCDGYLLAEREPASAFTFVQAGVASWYGREEQGKLTANGERFDRHELTAASRVLPFNSVVRVTNRENGKSVQVRVNDRGPFVKGRILDLSEAAADTLDMKDRGTAKVKIELVSPPSSTVSAGP